METRVWHKIEDKQGTVLALTGDAVHHISFSGKNAKQEATEAVTALLAGKDPATVVSSSSKAVPLAAINRVEVSHDHGTVKFHTVEADKPVKVEFMVRSGDDGPGIARAVVERTAITHPERSEDIGVVEALLAPVILGVIAGVAWVFVYFAATALDSDEEINVAQGGRRGRGLKRLIVFVAEILGTNGTIAVGAVLLAAFVGWAILRVVKRPQQLVWGPPAAT
jgi:hypothetical protein